MRPSRRPYCYAIRTDTQAGVGASGSSPVSIVARSWRTGRGKKKRLQGMLAASKGAVTYSPTFAVPSAWRGLTSLFGMGRGGAPALSPPWSFAFVLRHAPPCMTGVSQERRRSVTWKRTQEPSRISLDLLFLYPAFVVGGLSPGKGFGRLVTLGCVHCCTCTCVLSTS